VSVKTLSAFFPCYNEELNLEGVFFDAIHVLDNVVQKYEILIINDGSTDKTGLVADELSKQHNNVRVIHHKSNLGYGSALITGFNHSLYEWIFFTDGDHQFFINEIEILLKEINDHDLIIGYRKERQDPRHRLFYGWAWNLLVQRILGLKFRDTNCAFKLIRKEVLDHIRLHSAGAMISTELLWKTKVSGFRIKEVGVSHRPRVFGTQTGGNPKVVLKAFVELFELWISKRRSNVLG
jgi:glycosyltransferase involved in cell wall biosynthesis